MQTTTKLMLASAVVALMAATPATAQTTKVTAYLGGLTDEANYPGIVGAIEGVIADYEKLHPEVDIELLPFINDVNTYQAWLTTRFSGGDQPDIAWQQFYQRNVEPHLWLPVNEYLEQPNPYIAEGEKGASRWGDIFFPNVLAQIRAGDANWYQFNTNWVETGLFINQDVFDANGVTAEWNTWADLIKTCADLRAKGVQPMGVFMTPAWSTYQWLDDIIVTGAFADVVPSWYMEKYNNEFMPWRQLNQEEFAKAVKEGKFSTSDPRFDTYLKLTKDFADNCIVEGFAGLPDYDSIFNMFYDGGVAMAWLGSWSAGSLGDVKFNIQSAYLPPFTKTDSEYAVHETSYRVGGPSSSGQIGVTLATKERGTTDAAIDFLKFFTAPANYQKIADRDTGNIPVIEGVKPTEVASAFQGIAQMPERGLTDPIGRLDQEFGTAHNRLFQSFMIGEMSADDLKGAYQKELDDSVERLCETNAAIWAWCAE
jgi:raffinose/stachyose/melibiose transport system substrate-binding protein